MFSFCNARIDLHLHAETNCFSNTKIRSPFSFQVVSQLSYVPLIFFLCNYFSPSTLSFISFFKSISQLEEVQIDFFTTQYLFTKTYTIVHLHDRIVYVIYTQTHKKPFENISMKKLFLMYVITSFFASKYVHKENAGKLAL